jgi:hypothetical protein
MVTTPPVPNSTSISSPACGAILSDIWNTIFCHLIPSASGYRFRVKNGATVVGTVDSTSNCFNLVSIGINNIVFGTAYTIDVLLQFGGVWLPDTEYGTSCVIIAPPTPGVSKITNPSCGSTTNNLWTSVFALQISGAQGYKFVVTNGLQYREIVTPINSFSIHSIPGGPVAGTTYTIRVDVLYNNSYVPGRELCTLIILPTATRVTQTPIDTFEIKGYPNPFADNFKLDINTSNEANVGVRVYDMLGRAIESKEATVAEIMEQTIGDHYPSGVYTIIVSQGEHLKTLRMIKR